MQKWSFLFIYFILSSSLCAQIWQPAEKNPVELGKVHWLRSYDQAKTQSKRTGKPIFLLFQEVPGCTTCRNYGQDVMSHPLIIEAIETYFIPLCIYNNKNGEDAKVLQTFKEPSWNNPVVRIIDQAGFNLIPRINGKYDIAGVTAGIMQALEKERISIPPYLSLLHQEYSAIDPQETVLGMYCFWSGEKAMSQILGVLACEAGFMHGKEVVKVTYDANITNEEEIAKAARQENCADIVFTNNTAIGKIPTQKPGKFHGDPESKYYIYKSPYRSLPMTELQALRVNYELSQGGDPGFYLSPRQNSLHAYLLEKKEKSSAIGKSVVESWYRIIANR